MKGSRKSLGFDMMDYEFFDKLKYFPIDGNPEAEDCTLRKE